MKFILILYICSFNTGECPNWSITGKEFSTHKECVLMGYREAYSTFRELEAEEVALDRLIVKFDCKRVNG